MRFIKNLNGTVGKTKTVSSNALDKYARYYVGGFENGKQFTFEDSNLKIPADTRVQKAYVTDKGVILYCEDGYLYLASERDFEKVTLQKYSVPPEVFSVIRKGEPSIVVSDGVTVTVLGEEVVIDKSSCLNGYVCFKGRAFSIKDNKIYFGTFSKLNVLDVDFITDNFLIINSRFGKLLKLINLNGELYLFATHGVFKVEVGVLEGNVNVKELCFFSKTIKEDTVAGENDMVFFMLDGKFCKYSNEKLVEMNSEYFDGESAVRGGACIVNGVYTLQIERDNKSFMFMCDGETLDQCILPLNDLKPCGNGYVFDAISKKIKILKQGFGEWSVIFKETDFGKDSVTTLGRVEFFSDGDFYYTVKGDFGEKTFSIKKGKSVVYPNVQSHLYNMKIFGNGRMVKVKKAVYCINL